MDGKRPLVFIQALSRFRAPNAFNPWGEIERLYDPQLPSDVCGYAERQDNLLQHLCCVARYVLVGEAPGYQGCRFSGIPFTSERLICEGAIPRVAARQLSKRIPAWSEPSATIVWKALRSLDIHEHTVLWNAFPFHPHKPGEPYSNRAPTKAEMRAAAAGWHLRSLLELFPTAQVVAVGRIASRTLDDLEQPHRAVRHPARGGAREFAEGLRKIVYGHA